MTSNAESRPCRGKFCGRPGLPILPLRVAYVPNGESDLPRGVYAAGDLHHRSLKSGHYMLRTITEGFVFVWDKRYSWRAFAATAGGKFKEIPLADDERPTETPTFACAQEGHNLEASLISITHPDRIDESEQAWVGYSRAWWTRATRRKLAGDQLLRMRTMVQINAKAIQEGAHPNPAAGFRVDQNGDKLVDHVLEYRDHDRASALYAVTKTIPGSPVTALDRTREAAIQAATMYRLAEHGGIALALRDPVGVVQDIAAWRNYCAGLLAEYQLEQQNLREHVVADLIDGIKGQLQDAGRLNEWNERYAKHVDTARIDRLRRDHAQRLRELEEPITRVASDWALWFQSGELWTTLDTYDGDDRQIGRQLEEDCADCIDGAGALKAEQQVLDRILKEEPDGKHRALWLAFAAGDKSLVEFIKDKIGPAEQLDLLKNVREIGTSFKEWLEKSREAGQIREATVAAAIIGRTLASQLTRLVTEQPDLGPVLGTRITIVAAARMNTIITPFSYTSTTQALVYELYEAAWDPAHESTTTIRVDQNYQRSERSIRGSWISTQIEAETRIQITTWVPEDLLDDIQAQSATTATGGAIATLPRPALGAPLPTPFQGLTKWVKTLDAKFVGLGGILTIANISSAFGDYHKAASKGKSEDQRKAVFGIISGFMGLGAVVLETTGGAFASRVIPGLAKEQVARLLIRSGLLRLAGGALAAGASISEGFYIFTKSYDSYRNDDIDSAFSYGFSGLFFGLSGLASAATAIIATQTVLAAAGVTAASGGILGTIAFTGVKLALIIPVWGWIVLGIAALITGIYFLFKGKEQEDSELEIWMSRSELRNFDTESTSHRIPYENLDEELEGFRQAIFGLRVEFYWEAEIGRDRLIVKAILPGYGERSVHAYSLSLANGRNRMVVGSDTSTLSADPELRPQPAAQHELRAAQESSWLERQATKVDEYVEQQQSRTGWQDAWRSLRQWRLDQQDPVHSTAGANVPIIRFQRMDGYAELVAELLIDEALFQKATLKLEYWPDALQMPQLRMTPSNNGLNYQIEGRD